MKELMRPACEVIQSMQEMGMIPCHPYLDVVTVIADSHDSTSGKALVARLRWTGSLPQPIEKLLDPFLLYGWMALTVETKEAGGHRRGLSWLARDVMQVQEGKDHSAAYDGRPYCTTAWCDTVRSLPLQS